MRIIAFIFSFLIIYYSNAQTVIDKCVGIKFGSSMAVVKQKMMFKVGCIFDATASKGDTLVFKGTKLDGMKTLSASFRFTEDKFYECVIYLSLEGVGPTDVYFEAKNIYCEMFYSSPKTYEKITTVGSIKVVKSGIVYWCDEVGNSVTLETNDKWVKVKYRDAILYKKAKIKK